MSRNARGGMMGKRLMRYRASIVAGKVHVRFVEVEQASWTPHQYMVIGHKRGLIASHELFENPDDALKYGRQMLQERFDDAWQKFTHHRENLEAFDRGDYTAKVWPNQRSEVAR